MPRRSSGGAARVRRARAPLTRSSEAGKELDEYPRARTGQEPPRRRRARQNPFENRPRDHRGQPGARRARPDRDPDPRRPARPAARASDRGARRSRARARRRRHHLLSRRRHRPRRRGPARGSAGRPRDAARLPARRADRRPRRRRALHRAHDPRGDRGALRLRPAGTRPARRARRPRPPRAADPPGLCRQEPADGARRADPGAARRGGRARRRPTCREPRGREPMIRLVRDDLRPPADPPKRHLLSVGDLTRDDVERLLGTARTFEASLERHVKKLPTLKGHLIVNLFYESSTRTSSSFELAAKRLSADTLTVKSVGSSVDKGESLKDTAVTLGAYDPDVIVIRHPQIGAAQFVAAATDAHVVNAGDGKHQHPTQALLDVYTLQQELGRLDGLHVAVVGDILHSRVARSLVQAFRLVGIRCTLVGPPALLPRELAVEKTTDIDAIRDADVIYVLRMQKEGMEAGANSVPSLREYAARGGVTPEGVRPGQKIMHPGPMNRGVEIDGRVADSADALIVEQVRAGLVVRMAVLYDLLTHGPVAVEVAAVGEVA